MVRAGHKLPCTCAQRRTGTVKQREEPKGAWHEGQTYDEGTDYAADE